MTTLFGYARVSSTDQDLDLQLAALKAAGCDVIRAEKRSGASTEGRRAALGRRGSLIVMLSRKNLGMDAAHSR